MDRRTTQNAKIMGEHPAAWRKMLDLTSQQIADRAGISRTTLSKLENGGSVGYGAFLSVTRALGIIDQILDAVDPWKSDLRRMRADQDLPQRVRHRG